MTSYTARPLNTAQLLFRVNQVAHGFNVGDVIMFNGAWVLAQANAEANCESICMVFLLVDVDNFFVTQEGEVFDIAIAPAPFIAGTQFWLSPFVAGQLTAVNPTTVGHVRTPCFKALTTDSGLFFGGTGELIEAPTQFQWNTVTMDTTMIPNEGYIVNAAANVNLTLPINFSVGDVMEVKCINTGTVTLLQNGGQSIIFGAGGSTTVGAGGSLAGTTSRQSVTLTGAMANTLIYADSASTFLAT